MFMYIALINIFITNRLKIRTFHILLLVLNLFVSIDCLAEFKIYDATLYKNKPDLEIYNIKSIPIVYENSFFGINKDVNVIPDPNSIVKVINKISGSGSNMVVLDIERWPLKGDKQSVNASLSKYINVIENLREKGVEPLMGYYGIAPIRNYWSAINSVDSASYLSWKKENDLIQSLVNTVDILFPSLYTFYSDQEGWKKYAIAQISEARRLAKDKPVIVFLWPQYHDSNRIIGKRYMSAKFWRLQLDTVRIHADGVVIWGGWKQNWDSNAPWWIETIQFMKDNGL